MASLHGVTETATMKAAFPNMPNGTNVTDIPSLKSLLSCLQHLVNCAQSFRVDGRPLGLLALAVTAPVYALYTPDAYPARSINPGANPAYHANAGPVPRLNVQNLFGTEYRTYQDENHMDEALIDRLYTMLGSDRAQDLRDRIMAIANPTFLEVYNHAVQMWGHSTPSSRDENVKSLKAAWHETEGMAKLWRQIKTAVNYAVYAGQPIPPEQIVDAALICINRTQAYKQDYLAYKRLPVQNITALKAHFDIAERDRREVEDEAGQHGYGMNAMEQNDRQLQQGLTDLAAAITLNETANNAAAGQGSDLQQQAQAMASSLNALQSGMVQMQQQMANLAMAQQAPAPIMPNMQMKMPMMPFCAPAMTQQAPPAPWTNTNNFSKRGAPPNPVK